MKRSEESALAAATTAAIAVCVGKKLRPRRASVRTRGWESSDCAISSASAPSTRARSSDSTCVAAARASGVAAFSSFSSNPLSTA